MGKFNPKKTVGTEVDTHPDRTTNYEDGIAFRLSPKLDLTSRAMSFLVGEPKFYGDTSTETEEMKRLIATVAEGDPEYIIKLASYIRNKMYLRSAPIFFLVEAVQYDNVKPFVRKAVPHILKRADELTEVIALFTQKHGSIGEKGSASLPNSLKKGIADSFYSFDAYQFAKYNRKGTVTIRDVQRLVHPKPRNEDEIVLFKQIATDTLPTPETWETVISGNGSTKENWEMVTPKMGYMAKLRNLRNFLKVGANIDSVIEHLTNPKAVANSKQFPFRFLSAYKVLMGLDGNTSMFTQRGDYMYTGQIRKDRISIGDPIDVNRLIEAVETALELSVANVPRLPGRTAIFCDNSGSMEGMISRRSTITRNEVANVLGAMAHKICDSAGVGVFGSDFATVPISAKDSILSNAQKQRATHVGHSTNAWKAIRYLNNKKLIVDRILLFSDMQCYGRGSLAEEWIKYSRHVSPNAKLYSFDLAGYGTAQFPEDDPDVVLFAG